MCANLSQNPHEQASMCPELAGYIRLGPQLVEVHLRPRPLDERRAILRKLNLNEEAQHGRG